MDWPLCSELRLNAFRRSVNLSERLLARLQRRLESERDEKQLALVVDGKALGELFRAWSPLDGDEEAFHMAQEEARKLLVDVSTTSNLVVACDV